jgi:beta-N-acetylhexosaminidase
MRDILGALIALWVPILYAGWPEETLRRMSLDEKIGQLFIVAVTNPYAIRSSSVDLIKDIIVENYDGAVSYEKIHELIQKWHIGGVHFIGYGTVQAAVRATNYLQTLSALPLLMTQDFEWGPNMRLTDALAFPKAQQLGTLSDKLIYETGFMIGKQSRALGVHVNFGPVADVNNNPHNSIINDRSFGNDPVRVAQAAYAFMEGLRHARVIACAKHFPGHGDTDIDSHYALPVVRHTKERLDAIELYPFRELIQSGIPMIMTAHMSVPALSGQSADNNDPEPATLSYEVLTHVLKDELDFKGIVITDALNMKSISSRASPGVLELKSLRAGVDILLMSQDVPVAHAYIKKAIEAGEYAEDEIDERVLKILYAKKWAGLDKERLVDESLVHEQLYGAHVQELLSLLDQAQKM